MYSGDTFFHLSFAGQIGLAIVSAILALLTISLFLKISSRFGLSVKMILAIILFWLFVWLSPQIYYFYYQTIFANLPSQLVIQMPPSVSELFRLVTFSGRNNLSDHSKGLLFWLLIGTAFWKSYARRP